MASQIKLVVDHVQWPFAAFHIDFSLYFIRLEPVPQIFDATTKRMTIQNFDYWFQAKTQQRYSFRGFCDMVEAFRSGMAASFSLEDVKEIINSTADITKIAVMEKLGDYQKHYWIEALNPIKLEEIHAPNVRDKFEELRQKLTDDGFYNYLCRLWKFATNHRPGLAPVFEKLIGRLGRVPADPVYPITSKLDEELHRAVAAKVIERRITEYKNVSPEVLSGLRSLIG